MLSSIDLEKRQTMLSDHEKHRVVLGVVIPQKTPKEIEHWYGVRTDDECYSLHSGPNIWVLPMIAETVTSMYILVGNSSISMFTLNRCVQSRFGIDRWYKLYEHISTFANGQVKNFLVACSTYVKSEKDIVRVLLIGSKSHEGGGRWHLYYGMLLLRHHLDVTIDCFDYGEVPGEEVFEFPMGKTVRKLLIRHNAKFYSGNGTGYDVVVDDAFITTQPGVQTRSYVSPFWSRKDQTSSVSPFLHSTEGRVWSKNVEWFHQESTCPCQICSVSANVSPRYGDYCFIRSTCVVLGSSLCLRSENSSEIEAKARVLASISVSPSVQLHSGIDIRGVLSLLDEMPIAAVGPLEVRKASEGFLSRKEMIRKVGFVSVDSSSIEDIFVGKSIVLRGVPAEIFGSTPLTTRSSSTTKPSFIEGEILFCASRESALTVAYYEKIWYPDDRPVPGYLLTGRRFREFVEFSRLPLEPVDKGGTKAVGGSGHGYWSKIVPMVYNDPQSKTAPSSERNRSLLSYNDPFYYANGHLYPVGPFPYIFDDSSPVPFYDHRYEDDYSGDYNVLSVDRRLGRDQVVFWEINRSSCSWLRDEKTRKPRVNCTCGMAHILRKVVQNLNGTFAQWVIDPGIVKKFVVY